MRGIAYHKARISLLLPLAFALAGCGCSQHHSGGIPTRTLKVSGTIDFQRKPQGVSLLHVGAVPSSAAFESILVVQEGASGVRGNSTGGLTVPYTCDVPLEMKEITSVSPRSAPSPRIPIHKSVRRPGANVKLFRVWVEPPAGWEASPKEYRVSKDSTHLDFTLRPMAGKGP